MLVYGHKFPYCCPLCLAVRYKIANSDEMKNILAVLEKKNPVTIKNVFML
jgi:hypothetical protein